MRGHVFHITPYEKIHLFFSILAFAFRRLQPFESWNDHEETDRFKFGIQLYGEVKLYGG